VTPFLTVAAFAEVVKVVVARTRPKATENTTDFVLFELFSI
jgi:hypothetical protein